MIDRAFLRDFHTIPVSISTVDHIGNLAANMEKSYRMRAYSELKILYSQLFHNKLTQGTRSVNVGDNVIIECTINWSIKTAVITVGGQVETEKKNIKCWCCGPCLVAGLVIDLKELKSEPKGPSFKNDLSYYADILVCQKADETKPSSKTKQTDTRKSQGSELKSFKYKQTNTYTISTIILNVPFSDRYRHKVGSSVLVLVSPLYKFIPSITYNPCINNRRLTQDGYAELELTTEYEKSTGMACNIMRDKKMWEETDPTMQPFRILPISLDTCLTGLK